MSSVLLLHHLGLGDHFMCHGIVREYAGRYGHVTIFSYPHNYPTVAFMFRDLKNLDITSVKDVEEAKAYIAKNAPGQSGSPYDEVKILGFENLDRTHGAQLEKQFYDQAGVPLSKKWSGFHVERDLEKERVLFERAAPKQPYAFLHEDASRKYIIKRKFIGKHHAVFLPSPELAENLFDYCTIIEQADEVHVIDSSFMFLIDCFAYENPRQKLFVHRYARENNEWQLPILKKDWRILTAEPSLLDPLRELLERFYQIPAFPFNTRFFRRSARWFFRIMQWTMGRPKALNIGDILKRYVPERSFMEIGGADHLDAAKAADATTALTMNLDGLGSEQADVVLYAGALPDDPAPLFRQLHDASTTICILAGRLPKGIEVELDKAGLGVREKQMFPAESCLVCRTL